MIEDFVKKLKNLIIKDTFVDGSYYNGYSWLDYFDSINIIGSHLSGFLELITSQSLNIEFLESKTALTPFDLVFGVSETEAVKACGKPSYLIDNSARIASCKALFYKKKIGTVRLVTQLHFFEDKLFVAKTDFSTNDTSENLHQKITRLTVKKYIGRDVPIAGQPVNIRDKDHNRLTINLMNVTPFITYVSGNRDLIEKVKGIVEAKKVDKKSKEKLINDELFNRL